MTPFFMHCTESLTTNRWKEGEMKQSLKTKQLTLTALLGTLSALLMYLKFPLPFIPPFIEFDFTNVVDMIGAFILGPANTILLILIKWLIKLLLQGTSTGFVGELSGIFLNLCYALPAAFLYRRSKTRQTAVIGMLIGCILTTILSVFSNLYVMFPLYGMSQDMIIAAFSAVNPFVHDTLSMALWSLVPFNLLKTGVSSIIVFLLYKHISSSLRQVLN